MKPPLRRRTIVIAAAAGLTAPLTLLPYGRVAAQGDAAPVTIGIEAKSFQFLGQWDLTQGANGASGGAGTNILTGGTSGAPHDPAVTAVNLPRAGHYRLWVRTIDFPAQQPGTRLFKVVVAGHPAPHPFGASGQATWTWENGGEYDLSAGPNLISLREATPFARADALLLTTDMSLQPGDAALGRKGLPAATRPYPLLVPNDAAADPLAASGPITDVPDAKVAAHIESAWTRIEWLPAQDASGRSTLRPRVFSKTGGEWREVPTDPAAEAYALVAGKDPHYRLTAFYPAWDDARCVVSPLTVSAGGVSETTLRPYARGAVWAGGEAQRMVPRAITPVPGKANAVRITFYPSPDGELTADWEIGSAEKAPRVTLTFTPKAAGSFTLGYETPWRKPLADVAELLLPPTYERRRFPDQPVTALDCLTPTPLALAQSGKAELATVWGVSGDPIETPFAWPDFRTPNFGLMIRDGGGQVHPAIYGPIPGREKAKCSAGQSQTFHFRLIAGMGDWYSGYRIAADEVYGLKDYRENDPRGSLTDAVFNMIDLFKDDSAGGWWPLAKANYQIESRNGASDCAPLVPLSLYQLTGDEDIYQRRALPTLEFLISRNGPHFSPTYDTEALYPFGGMDGPSKSYGAPIYGGLWEQTERRTPTFSTIAFPDAGSVRPTGSNNHAQSFDDWLARYEITGDKTALDKARTLADTYLAKQIDTAPTGDIGWEPFFLISYLPDWEGLLRLYEVTGEKKYLNGAAFGARQLMTGVWTQPLIPAGKTKVNDDGQFAGEGHVWWKGATPYRLGFPRKPGDTPVHDVDAWRVSDVGLSFEQPSTYRGGGGPGQMIFQAVWSPAFLRLARYTGDPTFETYARNAVVGRWTNYPGYYATGLTDIPMDSRYPYQGPDVSSIYYHHIPAHLGWTIDYLVSEAELRSQGAVSFPSLRQLGYAYFDGRIFGHAPGKIGAITDAWLWFRRGLVTLDNPQINYLTAHANSGRKLMILMMNESRQPQKVKLNFDAKTLGIGVGTKASVLDLAAGKSAAALPLTSGNIASLAVPPRGFVVVVLEGCHIDVPMTQRTPAPPLGQPAAPKIGPMPSSVTLPVSGTRFEGRAAAIQIRPGPWDAHIWCTATPKQVRQVTLKYRIDESGEWQTKEADAYPFEFSLPVSDPNAVVYFTLSGESAEGTAFALPESVLAAPAP